MRSRTFSRLVAAVVALAPVAASAQLDGTSLGLQYLFPTTGTIYQDLGTKTVGAGAEWTFSDAGDQIFDVDVSANTIRFEYDVASTWCTGGAIFCPPAVSFNGVRLFDAGGTAPAFTSVSLVSNAQSMVGLDMSRIVYDANNIYIDWKGLSFNEHTVVELSIGTSTVPEPATVGLMGFGLAALGVAVRRRKQSA